VSADVNLRDWNVEGERRGLIVRLLFSFLWPSSNKASLYLSFSVWLNGYPAMIATADDDAVVEIKTHPRACPSIIIRSHAPRTRSWQSLERLLTARLIPSSLLFSPDRISKSKAMYANCLRVRFDVYRVIAPCPPYVTYASSYALLRGRLWHDRAGNERNVIVSSINTRWLFISLSISIPLRLYSIIHFSFS